MTVDIEDMHGHNDRYNVDENTMAILVSIKLLNDTIAHQTQVLREMQNAKR